jgi:hypothetical protein
VGNDLRSARQLPALPQRSSASSCASRPPDCMPASTPPSFDDYLISGQDFMYSGLFMDLRFESSFQAHSTPI